MTPPPLPLMLTRGITKTVVEPAYVKYFLKLFDFFPFKSEKSAKRRVPLDQAKFVTAR